MHQTDTSICLKFEEFDIVDCKLLLKYLVVEQLTVDMINRPIATNHTVESNGPNK